MSRSDNLTQGNDAERRQPIVTVIIPCHNYGSMIKDAVESVIEQDYVNKSIVIVDDGSTDDSAKIIGDLLTKVSNSQPDHKNEQGANIYRVTSPIPILFISYGQAKGPAFARNVGIQASFDRSDIFGMLDADDYWLPGKISESVKKFVSFPNVGLVYSDNDTYDVKTKLFVREFREAFNYRRLLSHNMIDSSSFVSKAALAKVGGYDVRLRVSEDLDLWLKIAEKFNVIHIPESLVVHQVHGRNSTHVVHSEVWQKCWKLVGENVKERHANGSR